MHGDQHAGCSLLEPLCPGHGVPIGASPTYGGWWDGNLARLKPAATAGALLEQPRPRSTRRAIYAMRAAGERSLMARGVFTGVPR